MAGGAGACGACGFVIDVLRGSGDAEGGGGRGKVLLRLGLDSVMGDDMALLLPPPPSPRKILLLFFKFAGTPLSSITSLLAS